MANVFNMNKITVCYSTHRLETLELTTELMHDHDVIILEEPPHSDFAKMLSGAVDIEDHLLELDTGYPEFSKAQYEVLQHVSRIGKKVTQIEPYLENLIRIQLFFADGHSPDEIERNTISHAVYSAERNATKALIDYYKVVRGDDFDEILKIMNAFAMSDAARFTLRDTLRVDGIFKKLENGKNVYIEAGSIHLLLYSLLSKRLLKPWHLRLYSADREAVRRLGLRGNIFSPGDKLTLYYIWGRKVSEQKWQLECARSLIYSKIVEKEEIVKAATEFPHTLNEFKSIAAVRKLSVEDCKRLFERVRYLPTEEAATEVSAYSKKTGKVRT